MYSEYGESLRQSNIKLGLKLTLRGWLQFKVSAFRKNRPYTILYE